MTSLMKTRRAAVRKFFLQTLPWPPTSVMADEMKHNVGVYVIECDRVSRHTFCTVRSVGGEKGGGERAREQRRGSTLSESQFFLSQHSITMVRTASVYGHEKEV